jgi:hypothetical protein
MIKNRVQNPDSDWIRMQSGQWIRIRNPDTNSESRRAKIDPKNRKNDKKFYVLTFEVLDVSSRAEGFSCCMGVLYGGLG